MLETLTNAATTSEHRECVQGKEVAYGRKEGIAIGAEQGEQRKAASIITNMLRKGKGPEEIADMTGENLEEIQAIQKRLL